MAKTSLNATKEAASDDSILAMARALSAGDGRLALALLHALAERRLGASDALATIEPEALRYEAGRLALKLGLFDESITYLSSAEQTAPERPNLQYLVGLAHDRTGHRETAVDHFQSCLERRTTPRTQSTA